MELLVIWIICGVVTAIIAASKGRSGAGWLLVGLLLGIFGVILIACLPALVKEVPRTPQQYAAIQEPRREKNCPDCGETVLDVAKVCKHCGYRFDHTQAIKA
ncbi:zinc ribbon domain-containing protein [Sinorhizobium meliloti]|nr:hypothetical protein U8C39_31665 [Sinorhizobium meliloti]WQP19670.1 hypothetical protein U8C33_32095 [Sinorhizobium meliloti]WQP33159.1 hypothetical protein U8C45_31630 [Sinorhizobium meliloti]